jgi:hypothetical protein
MGRKKLTVPPPKDTPPPAPPPKAGVSSLKGETFETLTIDRLCDAVIAGESLREMAAVLGCTPMTVLRWIDRQPDGRELYMAAKREMAELYASDLMAVVNAEPARDAFGRVDSGSVQHQRLKADSIKWVASKLLPKVYGEKLDLTSDGSRLGLTEEQVDARILALLQRTGVSG